MHYLSSVYIEYTHIQIKWLRLNQCCIGTLLLLIFRAWHTTDRDL